MIVGSGVDVIEIARIERALARSGERFARRVFASAEIRACQRFERASPHFAIRFAAKEAFMKALGTGWGHGVRWVDIQTVESARNATATSVLCVQLHGRAGEIAEQLGASRHHLTVSRTRSHAIALALLESPRP